MDAENILFLMLTNKYQSKDSSSTNDTPVFLTISRNLLF